METSPFLAAVALCASVVLAAQPALADPVIQADAGSYAVGDTVTLSITDYGIDRGGLNGQYLANLSVDWDPRYLRLLDHPLTPSASLSAFMGSNGSFNIAAAGYGGAASVANVASYQIDLSGDMPASSGQYALFTLSFEALLAVGSTDVILTQSQGGSYGASTSPFIGSVASFELVNIAAVPAADPVPEPSTLAMYALALASAMLVRRRLR
jgi:hypothetical protein